MHEVSIVEGMLVSIDRQRRLHGFTKVIRIELVCGPLNCASEENLQFCYDNAVKGTWLDGAVVTLDRTSERNDIYLKNLEVE